MTAYTAPYPSMRPARKGPENEGFTAPRKLVDSPSMRPARKGPENCPANAPFLRRIPPSMRPARKGPENEGKMLAMSGGPLAFNEAGPQGAGKPADGSRAPTGLLSLQ